MAQEDSIKLHRATIVGPGLLGASIAIGLKEKEMIQELWVWLRNESKIKDCIGEDWCDYATINLKEAIQGSDLVVLCTPIETIVKHINLVSEWAKPGCIVTDVGSLKKRICEEAENRFKGKQSFFTGSHPMAGSEKSGMRYADSKILQNKSCIITPTAITDSVSLNKLEKIWEVLGFRVTKMNPDKHDQVVGCISHLPHIMATVLMNTVHNSCPQQMELSGDGLKDTTRIAAGNPKLWEQILLGNKDNLVSLIEEAQTHLQEFKEAIASNNGEKVTESLMQGQEARQCLNDDR